MIVFDQVTKEFPNGDKAIDQVSFEINPQEFVFITGRSGAGKTTLLRLLLRELLPTAGTILVDKQDISQLHPKKLPEFRRKIGAAFQDLKILWDRTVAENIALALEILGHTQEETISHVNQLLELVGLPNKADLFPSQISGGELQRAVIARALATKPKILFADEPTGNLDEATATQIIKLLQEINNLGTTVIVATHNRSLVDSLDARTLVLDKGKLMEDHHSHAQKKK